MWEWLRVKQRPDTDSNYHKPYAYSLWSRCKVKSEDDKQHLKHESYQYRPLMFLLSRENKTGCQPN